MTRTEAESIFCKVLLDEMDYYNKAAHQELCEAINLAVGDMHKMTEIEETVGDWRKRQ